MSAAPTLLISADSHVNEPRDLWSSSLPPRLRDQAMRGIAAKDDGGWDLAQTIAFADYIAHQGEQGAKEAGKMRAEGKDYVVQDGDVMNFLFSG